VVMGSHATGLVHRLGALHHVLRWFGRGLIRAVPVTPRSSVELIAVETAARFLARAAAEEGWDRAIWHVTAGEGAVGLQELMDLALRGAACARDAPVTTAIHSRAGQRPCAQNRATWGLCGCRHCRARSRPGHTSAARALQPDSRAAGLWIESPCGRRPGCGRC